MSDEYQEGVMSTVRRFEDLIAWQKARALTKAVYLVTRRGSFARDFGLSAQMRKAAVSIMSNIAEGFERSGPAEFHQFLFTAKASCAEVRSQLYVAFDIEYLERSEFAHLLAQTEEVGRILGGLRASVEKRRDMQRKVSKRTARINSPPETHRSSLIAHR